MVEFAFGDNADGSKDTLPIGLPLLAGASREPLGESLEVAHGEAGLRLWRGAGRMIGIACAEHGAAIETTTGQIYERLLKAAHGLHLYRIWNLVPQINAAAPGGLENYRAFCRGRSLAFELALGQGFTKNLPAASAVGTTGCLTVAFLAGEATAQHFENPAQVPAYEYPQEYGPRPPSFARATVVEFPGGTDTFISGTSAVVGHETIAPNDTPRQLERTFDNLSLISTACGLGEHIGRGAAVDRHYKVYLRNPADLAAVAASMVQRILKPGDRVSYLGADICRSALNVEIEVAVRGAQRS
jgi:chorismate lyase/3-hydroxybenzoate synthase